MDRFKDVPNDWILLNEDEYHINGVADLKDVENLKTYIVGKIMNSNRTGSFLYYGKEYNFIEDYYNEMKEVQKNFNLQEEIGFFPAHVEKIGLNCAMSVVKLIKNPSMYIVDIMIDNEGYIYAYHTYIDKTEKNLWVNYLATKYNDIKYVVEKLEN